MRGVVGGAGGGALRGAHPVGVGGGLDESTLTNKVFCTCSEADGVSFKASDILYSILTESGPGRKARGFTPEELARITCPIGVPGITGKEPEVIAVAVAAQLLQSLG